MKKLFAQIFKFGFVGGLCFIIEYVILILLTDKFGVHVLISNVIAFSVSVTVNYILSMKFVFESDDKADKKKEFVKFIVLSIIGLGINQLVMWIGNITVGVKWYKITKIAATAVVMVYNFITRKLLMEKKSDK